MDPGTGVVKVRRFLAVDDCGVRINPMIVEGQIHGGLADGLGMALMQAIAFDADGNCLGGSFMDYLLPTSVECPSWDWPRPSPVPPPSDRGQRSRRIGHGGLARRGGQRGHGRAQAARGAACRHAAHAGHVWSAIQGTPLRTDLAFT